MAKVKVINSNLDENLNDSVNFSNTPSQTIFSFGSFTVTSNFDNREYIDYNNQLSSFVRSVTLDTMGLTDTQSEIIQDYSTNAVLNLDKSDMNTFIRFGSAYEFLRASIENIILGYPGALFLNSQNAVLGNVTYFDLAYDSVSNTSTFKIPTNSIENKFNLIYNYGNTSEPDDVTLKNINLSYSDYVVWTSTIPNVNNNTILGYTGNTSGRDYLMVKCTNNPFSGITTGTSAPINFQLKPNNVIFDEYRELLTQYEKYIVSTRDGVDGFRFTLKEPRLLDDGSITYSNISLLWETSDDYNIDIDTPAYNNFVESILTIGAKYDSVKTDLIARFLTPASIKDYDETEEGKITKLLRVYGWEFDRLREFIDSLVYINRVSYDKVNNIPDQLVQNLSRTFGWDYFSLINESDLVKSFLNIDDSERNLDTDLLPSEINIELWRRILLNTNYFWKSKGTREAIKSMFLLIGIPEQFINITEYVYTVEGKIDPRNVALTEADFPSNSLPYNNDGYPTAPLETNDFYFQTSGDTDSGQAYMDVFRSAGFNLQRTVDNKKSWVQSGATNRIDDTTPQYYQEDSELVLNTKEVTVALDTARGVEEDVYDYIQTDYAANSSGYTLPYSYINLSLAVDASQTTFTLPYNLTEIEGDFEVRFNGILLNAPKTGSTTGITSQADYSVSANTFTLLTGTAINSGGRRDVIQTTLITSGGTSPVSGITVDYIVTRISANLAGTIISLPSKPRGDVQATINGIALTKGTAQFTADYIVDDANNQLIIQNPELITYLQINPDIQVAYVEVTGSDDISARSEVLRVDSFSGSKFYFNQSANKNVYKLNYKANSAADLKVLIDGIALEPGTDYSINTQNNYEIFLPKGISYGTIITIYYLVATNDIYNPIIDNSFGLGDISELSFIEFIELIQKRMINARNRKTITDFKGGWYPSLFRIYSEYLKRAALADDNPLQSNGYTFENLYSFLSKYNSFFQRFVTQLLPATIIQRSGGLLIRNSVFTKQKFMYRRGVNIKDVEGSLVLDDDIDVRGNLMYEYLGDDGALFKIKQTVFEPTPPQPVLYVETVEGSLSTIAGEEGRDDYIILITGGERVLGGSSLTEYGIIYRSANDIGLVNPWIELITTGTLSIDNFSTQINKVTEGLTYEFKAFVRNNYSGYTGNTLSLRIPLLVTPSLETIRGDADLDSIDDTGGENIVAYDQAEYYGMQYRAVGSGDADIELSPSALSVSAAASTQYVIISGDSWNVYTASGSSGFVIPQTSQILSTGGTTTSISISTNTGGARKASVQYIPSIGTTKTVTITQQAADGIGGDESEL